MNERERNNNIEQRKKNESENQNKLFACNIQSDIFSCYASAHKYEYLIVLIALLYVLSGWRWRLVDNTKKTSISIREEKTSTINKIIGEKRAMLQFNKTKVTHGTEMDRLGWKEPKTTDVLLSG